MIGAVALQFSQAIVICRDLILAIKEGTTTAVKNKAPIDLKITILKIKVTAIISFAQNREITRTSPR